VHCPACENKRLNLQALEVGLGTLACDQCGGHWIQAFQYWKWLDAQGKNLPEKPESETAALTVCDGDEARVCPECTRILIRCKVGRGLAFYLDRCTNCGGIWFDQNEWAVLKSRNLHDDVHFVFSQSWQDRNSREEATAAEDAWFVAQFGEQRMAEIKAFRAWLQTQEHASSVIRFLSERSAG